MGGLEECCGVVVGRPGPTLGDGVEAYGEFGLGEGSFDDLGARDAGLGAPDGGEGHDYQVIIYVEG